MEGLLGEVAKVNETTGGYAFAVFTLTSMLVVCGYIIVRLWKSIAEWKKDYIDLVVKTTTLLTEVNVKLDGHNELREKVEELHKDILEKKSCGYTK